MSPEYTEFHPRWYRKRISTYWWLERWSYLAFILRELSANFVAWFVIYLLLLVRAVGRGEESTREFIAWSGGPWILAVNAVSLAFILLHSVTWFRAAPRAMAVRFRGQRVPGIVIAGSNFAAWAAVSAVILWIVLGG
jgi:fumarate reductase subunit C